MFPIDKNLSSGEFGKTSKYKDLEIEIEQMYHLKPPLTPVVAGALGMVKKVQTNIYNKSLENQVEQKSRKLYKYKHSTYSEKKVVNLDQ